MSEECPGEGRCHGCLSWCSYCGTVSHVCDFPECDHHRRPEEILAELCLLHDELREAAGRHWEVERQWTGLDAGAYRNRTISMASEFSRLEAAEGLLEEELEGALGAGDRLAPRPRMEPPEADPRQLALF